MSIFRSSGYGTCFVLCTKRLAMRAIGLRLLCARPWPLECVKPFTGLRESR